MTEPAIEAKSVRKRFGKVQALDGLDLVAGRGEVTAILGPNGAGKTTFVRSVATLVKPDSGALRVAGVDASPTPPRYDGSSAWPASTRWDGRSGSSSRSLRWPSCATAGPEGSGARCHNDQETCWSG